MTLLLSINLTKRITFEYDSQRGRIAKKVWKICLFCCKSIQINEEKHNRGINKF